MSLDPRHLGTMLAVVQHGTFNRAAAALGISQPALSKSIALLERKIGAKVFERGVRGSKLTSVGRIVALRAENLNQLLVRMEEEIREASDHRDGPLVIGATPSMMLALAPEALARLFEANSRQKAILIEGLDDHLTPALERGEIDLMVGPVHGLHAPPPQFAEEIVAQDAFFVVLPRHHPKASASELHLADLDDETWLLPSPGSSFHRSVEALFMTAGIPWPRHPISTNSLQVHERLITRVNCVAIATKVQLVNGPQTIRAVPLAGAAPRAIGVRRRTNHTLPVMAGEFVQHLRSASIDLDLMLPAGD